MSLNSALDTARYVVTDDFFGEPFIDIDEERSNPPIKPMGMRGDPVRMRIRLPHELAMTVRAGAASELRRPQRPCQPVQHGVR